MHSGNRLFGLALAGTALLTLCACSSTLPPAAERVSSHMFANLSRIGEIQSALILGDLDGARRPARWVESYISAEHLGAEAADYMMEIRAIARRIDQATSIEQATRAAGELGARCGSCHLASGGGPRMTLLSPLPDGETRIDHMRRHLWAVDRMWEGLVSPSDMFWRTGASAFTEMPPHGELWPGNAAAADEWMNNLHATGLVASTARGQERRGELYGEVIQGCANCHQEMRVGR